jgi:hypothetical protein
MATTRIIRCASAPGFDGCWRAGRFWPAKGTLVEITSSEDDVAAAADSPLRIGKKTFVALQGDHRFSFGIAGDADEIDKVREKAGELEEDLRRATEFIDGREKELAAARDTATGLQADLAAAHARIADLEKGNLSLKDQCAELKAQLDELAAHRPGPVLEGGEPKKKGGGKG